MAKLTKWEHLNNYMGETYYDYYVVVGQSRDSDCLAQSNFAVALERLGGEKEGKVIVVHSGHWAVGWIETLMVKDDYIEGIEIAQQITDDLEQYPVLSEEDYFKRQIKVCIAAIKDSLYQVSDLDDIPTPEDIYYYFDTHSPYGGIDNPEEFYPSEDQLREAIETIAKEKTAQAQIAAGRIGLGLN